MGYLALTDDQQFARRRNCCGISTPDHLGVQNTHNAIYISCAEIGEKQRDDFLVLKISRRLLRSTSDSPAGAAGELAHRRRSPLQNNCDFLESKGEYIVHDEGKALRWGKGVEHYKQSDTHGVGHFRLLFWIRHSGPYASQLLFKIEALLGSRFASPQHIKANAGQDGDGPAFPIVNLFTNTAVQPQPSLLNRIFRLRDRPKHAKSDGTQIWPTFLKPLDPIRSTVHSCHTPLCSFVIGLTIQSLLL